MSIQQGIKELEPVTSDKDAYTAAAGTEPDGRGAGAVGQVRRGGGEYEKAAAKAPFKVDHDVYMASAARALTTAGKTGRCEEDLVGAGEATIRARRRPRRG